MLLEVYLGIVENRYWSSLSFFVITAEEVKLKL